MLGSQVVKNPSANAGDIWDASSISGSRRCPGRGNGNPLQYSCLKNPTDRGTWQATVHGVEKSWTQISDRAHTHTHTHTYTHTHTHTHAHNSLLPGQYKALKGAILTSWLVITLHVCTRVCSWWNSSLALFIVILSIVPWMTYFTKIQEATRITPND